MIKNQEQINANCEVIVDRIRYQFSAGFNKNRRRGISK